MQSRAPVKSHNTAIRASRAGLLGGTPRRVRCACGCGQMFFRVVRKDKRYCGGKP